MPKYTVDFLSSIRERLSKVEKGFLKGYVIDIDGELAMPPLLDVVRYMSEYGGDSKDLSVESKSQLVRQMIVGKSVEIFYKGKRLGAFTMNSPKDLFDAYPVLAANPPALSLLMEICAMKMVEKWMPPKVESDPPAAAAETEGSAKRSDAR